MNLWDWSSLPSKWKCYSLSCIWLFLIPWSTCSPPELSVHGIRQARILEWIAIHFSRGSSLTQRSNPGLLHCRQILYYLSTREALSSIQISVNPWPWLFCSFHSAKPVFFSFFFFFLSHLQEFVNPLMNLSNLLWIYLWKITPTRKLVFQLVSELEGGKEKHLRYADKTEINSSSGIWT